VAITIRNKTTEELIRKIGRRTGEGPSAVVRRLAEREVGVNDNSDGVPDHIVAERMERVERLTEKYSSPDDPKLPWAEVEKAMDSIFGNELDSIPRLPR